MFLRLGIFIAGFAQVGFVPASPATTEGFELEKVIRLNGDQLEVAPGSQPFKVRMSLFADHAMKLRTIVLPPGGQVEVDDGAFVFPLGTILSKSFYFPNYDDGQIVRPHDSSAARVVGVLPLSSYSVIETRILLKRESGWVPYSYIWREGAAKRSRLGGVVAIKRATSNSNLNYIVPSEAQCPACHVSNVATGELNPLGFKPLNLDYDSDLRNAAQGLLSESAKRLLEESGVNADPGPNQARLYLDVSCAHCHNPGGRASYVGLDFRYGNTSEEVLGICKQPVSYQDSRDQFVIDASNASNSSLWIRIATSESSIRMPPIGRSLIDTEGAAVIGDWIRNMPVSCDVAPPRGHK